MSFRAPGETFAEQLRAAEQDIRYLYKCCQAVESFMVGAATEYPNNSNPRSNRWYSRLGPSTLYGLIATIDIETVATTYFYGDIVCDVLVNENVVGSVTIDTGDNIGVATVNPTVELGLTDYLTFEIRQGGGRRFFVAALLEGAQCGSAGLEFRFSKG